MKVRRLGIVCENFVGKCEELGGYACTPPLWNYGGTQGPNFVRGPSVSARHVSGGVSPPSRKSPTPPEIFCRPQFLERVIPYVAVRIRRNPSYGYAVPNFNFYRATACNV